MLNNTQSNTLLTHTPIGQVEPTIDENELVDSNRIRELTGDYFCEQGDWIAIPFAESRLAQIPLYKGYENDGSIIVEFSPAIEFDHQDVIVFSDGKEPELSTILSYSHEEGGDIRTFNLVKSRTFTECHTDIVIRALEAAFLLIDASTKLDNKDKTHYLSLLRADIDYLWSFIKRGLVSPIGYPYISGKIDILSEELRNTSWFFWQIVADHKTTDFNFNLNK